MSKRSSPSKSSSAALVSAHRASKGSQHILKRFREEVDDDDDEADADARLHRDGSSGRAFDIAQASPPLNSLLSIPQHSHAYARCHSTAESDYKPDFQFMADLAWHVVYEHVPVRAWYAVGLTCKRLRQVVAQYPSEHGMAERKAALGLPFFRLEQSSRDVVLRATKFDVNRFGGTVAHCFNCLRFTMCLRRFNALTLCRRCTSRVFASTQDARRWYGLNDDDLTCCAATVVDGTVCFLKRELYMRALRRHGGADAFHAQIVRELAYYRDAVYRRTRLHPRELAAVLRDSSVDDAPAADTFVYVIEPLMSDVERRESFAYAVPDPLAAAGVRRAVPWTRKEWVVQETGEVIKKISLDDDNWYAQRYASDDAARTTTPKAPPPHAAPSTVPRGYAETARRVMQWRAEYGVDDGDELQRALALVHALVGVALPSDAAALANAAAAAAAAADDDDDENAAPPAVAAEPSSPPSAKFTATLRVRTPLAQKAQQHAAFGTLKPSSSPSSRAASRCRHETGQTCLFCFAR